MKKADHLIIFFVSLLHTRTFLWTRTCLEHIYAIENKALNYVYTCCDLRFPVREVGSLTSLYENYKKESPHITWHHVM
jgi:hypothetical protein